MKEASQSGRTDAHGLWTGLPTQVGVLALSCGGQSNSCGAAQWEWVGLLSDPGHFQLHESRHRTW